MDAILTNLILGSEASEFLDGLEVGGEEESRGPHSFVQDQRAGRSCRIWCSVRVQPAACGVGVRLGQTDAEDKGVRMLLDFTTIYKTLKKNVVVIRNIIPIAKL